MKSIPVQVATYEICFPVLSPFVHEFSRFQRPDEETGNKSAAFRYRVDGEYEDGRHPKEVTFTASLEEDLKRRDFTINAMAYNPSGGLVDLFGGLEDIDRKIIRCVGDPLERFTEDALRIMRAVRFSAQLGFSIEEETRKALKVLAPNLKHVSAERIQVELVKLLMSPHPDYLRTAYEALAYAGLSVISAIASSDVINPS